MGNAACCQPGGACDCSSPPPTVNLDGASQEAEIRTGQTNYLVVRIGDTASNRLREHAQQGRRCAIEIELKVIRGKITGVEVCVNTQPRGNRKLIPLPVQPEPNPAAELYNQQQQQMQMQQQRAAWDQQQQYPPQQQQPQLQLLQPHNPHDLGPGGVRLRLLSHHTNNFETGEYWVTCNAIQPSSLILQANSLVEMQEGLGLQPLQIVTHQQKLLPPIPDVDINWGAKQTVINQQGGQQQQQQPYGQAQQSPYPRQPPQQQPAYAGGMASPSQQQRGQPWGAHTSSNAYDRDPYATNHSVLPPRDPHSMTRDDLLLHIRNLDREIYDQNHEIAALKKTNRSLDDKLYQLERRGGANNLSAGSSELQLNRYKEYILKAKEVIAQQKDRIVDLETTTMVGRLEAHLLEYKEYASRQKLKLSEQSQEVEVMDREVRELREENEELRARYHQLKRGASPRTRDEQSPRRTPLYSRNVRAQFRQGGTGQAGFNLRSPSGAYDGRATAATGGMSEWERDLMGAAPKTPTAGNFDRDRGYSSTTYNGRSTAEDRDRDRAREDERRLNEREWDREYERSHGYAAAPGANPYSVPSAASPYGRHSSNTGYTGSGRNRNAVSRKRASTSHYYDRYGSAARDERTIAAIKIQSMYRGHLYRKQHPESSRSFRSRKGHSSSSGSGSSSTYRASSASSASKHKAPTTHRPASSKPTVSSNSTYSSSSTRKRSVSPIRRSATTTQASRGSSASSKNAGASRRSYTSREEEDRERDRAARKIQKGFRSHLKRKEERSSGHRSKSTHKSSSSSSHHKSSSSSKPLSLSQQAASKHASSDRDRDRERDRSRERERDRDREGYSSLKNSSSRR